MITTLRIKKKYKDKLILATKWFSLLSILNDFKLTPLEIRLLAYTSIEGNISSGGKKEKFCNMFSSTKNSLANSIGKLHKTLFLIKKDGKFIVNPQLNILSEELLITLNLSVDEAT